MTLLEYNKTDFKNKAPAAEIHRFSFKPPTPRSNVISSKLSGTMLFKSDKLYNGMISELFKTQELRDWRGLDRNDLQIAIVDQMNKIVQKGLGGGRPIVGEYYEIRCKAGSGLLYVRC